MPAYNSAQFIHKAIESVLAQTFNDWELIVVDDGSTDDTKKVVAAFIEKDSRIKYFYQHNKKQAAARNLGIAHSKGEFISFLDSDDLWVPQKLQVQMDVIKSTEADVYYSGGSLVDEDDNFIRDYPSEYGIFPGATMYRMLYKYNAVPILSAVVKRRMLDKIGLMDESPYIVGCEDLDYWIRLACAGATFYGLDEKLFSYRVNPEGTSRNIMHMHFAEKYALTKNLKKGVFTIKEIRRMFKPSILPLAVYCINNSTMKEASALLKNAWKNVPLLSYKFSYLIFKTLRKQSIFPIRIINKIDSIIHGEKYISTIVLLRHS